jgi:2-polyprenyl-3-methyl-5-hydroxy-6-metoxy-1,4-benzoquinol methylase
MLNKALAIAKKYKQHKKYQDYVDGFGTYYKEVFKLLPKSKRTLDIGCAYGTLALMMHLRGDKVTASDMSTEYINTKMLKKEGIKFEKIDIEKSAIKGKYNLITLTETIEHFNSNPSEPLRRIFDALEDQGHVFVSTVMKEVHGDTTSMNGGEKGLWNDLLSWRDIPEYKGKWKDQHTFHYDQYNLVTLLVETGFEIEKIGNINNFSHYIIGKKC